MESRKKSYSWLASLLPILIGCQGCTYGITHQRAPVAKNAIPAAFLPSEMTALPKEYMVPIEWTRLRRPPVREHIVGPEDVLGVYVEEVLPSEKASPTLFFPGQQESPSMGQPMRVQADGTIFLPLVGTTDLAGLTLPQATEKIRAAYLDKQILKEKQFVNVELIKARTVKVFVVRDDTVIETVASTERRKTMALELPLFENDVLHALSASGGLPSEDAYNEIWVLRGATISESQTFDMIDQITDQLSENDTIAASSELIRIPLRACPGQELPFSPDDIVLNDGDVVFIESRMEFYLTGGLIEGGQHLLPRDEDIDVLEAMAMAGNNAYGPVGRAVGNNFRGGPGALIPPTRVVIVRKLKSGEQIKIAVDVRAALNDPNERVLIQDRDVIILEYRTHEIVGNVLLNILRFDYLIDNFRVGVN